MNRTLAPRPSGHIGRIIAVPVGVTLFHGEQYTAASEMAKALVGHYIGRHAEGDWVFDMEIDLRNIYIKE